MSSPQTFLAKSVGGVGAPRFIGDTLPVTGDFYAISFISVSQIGHQYQGQGIDITGRSFPEGYVLGGNHSVVQLNSGSAVVYG